MPSGWSGGRWAWWALSARPVAVAGDAPVPPGGGAWKLIHRHADPIAAKTPPEAILRR